jgi:hypothetical protein
MSFSYSVTHLVEHSNIKIDPDNQSEPTPSVAAEAATTGKCVTTHLPRVATVLPASCATSKPPRAPSCEKLSPVAVAPASRPGDRCSGGSSAGATPAWWTAWWKILDRMSWPSPAPQCTPSRCRCLLPQCPQCSGTGDRPHWLAAVGRQGGAALPPKTPRA